MKLTTKQVAAELGVRPAAVRRMVERGELPADPRGPGEKRPGNLMFDSAEFRKWKKERNERPAPPPRPPAPALAAPPLPFVPPLAPAAGTGWVGQRFEAIDRKLDTLGGKIDQLLKTWGIE